ncbi:hypothetical protein RBH29_08600 [Herbivorax sp. ANBcel31]|uniref:hypothetical protein n=1 Tax=Herbivorax sp. ANBcel31 TaxID=3069754 RepID=UPI0027AE0B82|nr:hypothetical protein [Herbivorax sp. ANBcel31]MDQ2086485.1 hypothetical protein [Herbivorax sp. ANBcel31]
MLKLLEIYIIDGVKCVCQVIGWTDKDTRVIKVLNVQSDNDNDKKLIDKIFIGQEQKHFDGTELIKKPLDE